MQHVFALPTTTEVRCSNVNLRTEHHGDDLVRAIDLSFWMEGGNELLNLFHPDIRATFYCNRAAEEGQVDLPDVLAVLPNLRLAHLVERQAWQKGEKYGGYRLILDYGLGDEQANVDLTGCTVAKKWFEPKEGGTVRIGWVVQYAGEVLDDETMRGRLTGLVDQQAFIQLHAPAVLQLIKGGKGAKPAAADTAGAEDADGGDADADEEQDAGDIFAAHHGGEAAAAG